MTLAIWVGVGIAIVGIGLRLMYISAKCDQMREDLFNDRLDLHKNDKNDNG